MSLPNAVIVGVNKAGTTSLFNALAQQEGIYPSRVKETHFFDPLKYGEQVPPLDRYEELFPVAPAGATVIEATPEYFYGGEAVAVALDSLLPSVRVAVVLREPGERAFSWWRFCRSRLFVDRSESFDTYLERCQEFGRSAELKRELFPWRALSGGLYSEYLPWWQKTFGDRLLVLFYDELLQDFEKAARRVAEHFGAELHEPLSARQDNVTTDVRNRALQRLALRLNAAGERLWRAAPSLKRIGRAAYYRVNAADTQERLSDRHRTWLTDYFADERARLRPLVQPERWPNWLRAEE